MAGIIWVTQASFIIFMLAMALGSAGGMAKGHRYQHYLIGGLEHFYFSILGRIIPTDELIFFRGVGQPPTSFAVQDSSIWRAQATHGAM